MSKNYFILTSHFNDLGDGMSLSYYCSDGNKPVLLTFTQQKIIFFIDTMSEFNPPNIKFERKKAGFKNFSHQEVDTIYLNYYRDVQTCKQYCEENRIRTFELDIHPTERFLMERFIFGSIQVSGDSHQSSSIETYLNPTVSPSPQLPKLSLVSLDIETGVNDELFSIALSYQKEDELKNIVLMKSDEDKLIHAELTYYSTEERLLKAFLNEFMLMDPDLILGWHVIGFDLMFLERKCLKYNIPFLLGRSREKITLDERKGVGFFANIPGRVVLDGPPVIRGAFYNFKNFKLETVAMEVLGTGKDINSDGGKVSEIERRFREDKIALAKYNLLDCTLVIDIFKKLDILSLIMTRVQISGLLIDRLNVSTAAFDFHFLPKLHRKKYVAPNRIDIERDDTSTGGLVIEPTGGLHKNVAIFDFKSLYPSIIRTFKIDPYSNIQQDINTLKTPNGYLFSKTEHLLPEIIENLLELRAEAKRQNNKSLSQAIKILMNSFYGIMGSTRCRFYHSDLPSAITQSGQWILQMTIDFFKNRGLEVIYGDTDSIFVKIDDKSLSHKNIFNELCEDIDLYLKQMLKDNYHVDSFLECEFEKIFDQVFFSMARNSNTVAKKKYAGIINGEIEFKGMETVRSDWTDLAKTFQKEIFKMFFESYPIESFIKDFINKLENGAFDDQLVYTKRLTRPLNEYTKNIPVHVKAALKINHTGPYRLKEVSYVITKSGPEPFTDEKFEYDYSHYIEKQIKPIANDILTTHNTDFDSLFAGKQLDLFSL